MISDQWSVISFENIFDFLFLSTQAKFLSYSLFSGASPQRFPKKYPIVETAGVQGAGGETVILITGI